MREIFVIAIEMKTIICYNHKQDDYNRFFICCLLLSYTVSIISMNNNANVKDEHKQRFFERDLYGTKKEDRNNSVKHCCGNRCFCCISCNGVCCGGWIRGEF